MQGLLRGALALALLASIGVGVGGHLGWDLPLGADLAVPGPGQVINGADQDLSTTIQQVIQRSNDEQAQAIASHDPSAMADTLTSDRYQQMVQINQDLLDGGVTSIQLVRIEWGRISVDGATATATTFETWRTTLGDGTTEQSRDRNDYRLVLDAASGAWRIAADDHPDSGPGPSASSPPPQTQPLPGVPDDQSTSHNWSGYAATGGTFSAVSGTWTVPQFSTDGSFGVDATWVGIGGVRSHDLIQAGTQQTVSGAGRVRYEAWIELLPRASRPVPLVVHPGDSVTVSLSESAPDSWLIAFANTTTGQTYQVTQTYHSSHSSAEWVEEAPSGGRGGVLPLDNFGSIQFSSAAATKDGQPVTIAEAKARAITMLGAADQPLAIPSVLGDDGASFSIARTDAAATAGPSVPFLRGHRGD